MTNTTTERGHTMSDGLSDHCGTPRAAGPTLVVILLGVSSCAWLLSVWLATPEMRLGVLTGAALMPAGGQMDMSPSASMGLSAFIVTWTVMMVAMMVPSFIPAVWRFDASVRSTGPSHAATVLFCSGYLLVWSAVGAVADLVVNVLQGGAVADSMTALRVGAMLLIVAGLYQLSPLKQTCLRQCRSPYAGAAPSVGARRPGHLGAVHAGLAQGWYCLGSSWPLMGVLLLVGLMNLAWMWIIAGVIFVEKVVPSGDVVSKVVGWGLTGGGIILLAAPHTLPALA